MSSPCVNECFHSNCEGPRWYCGKKRGWRDISQQMSSATQWHFEAFPLAFDLHYARYHYSQDIASQCLCICSFGDSAATKTLPILCCPHSLPELCLLPVLVFTLAITLFSMQKSWFVEETQRNPYQAKVSFTTPKTNTPAPSSHPFTHHLLCKHQTPSGVSLQIPYPPRFICCGC